MYLKDFYSNFKIKPEKIYIFECNDTFLKKQVLKFLSKEATDFSFQHFFPDSNSFFEVIDNFKNMNLFGEKFIITYGTLEKLEKKEKEEIKKLIEKQKSLNTHNILLLFFKSLKKNDTLRVNAENKKCFYKLSSLNERQVKQYIIKFFKQHNINIDYNIPDYLIANLDNNLEAISNELQKIINSPIENNFLTIEKLQKIISPAKEENIFKLIDSFFKKDKKNTIRIFYNLIEFNTDIDTIINLFLSTINTIILIKTGKLSGKTDNEIISKYKIHPYSFKINSNKANHFTLHQLYSICYSLIKIQIDIRKKGINSKQLMLNFFLKN